MNPDLFEVYSCNSPVIEAMDCFNNKDWYNASLLFERLAYEDSIDEINFVRLLNCYENLKDEYKFNFWLKKFRKTGFGIKFYKTVCELI